MNDDDKRIYDMISRGMALDTLWAMRHVIRMSIPELPIRYIGIRDGLERIVMCDGGDQCLNNGISLNDEKMRLVCELIWRESRANPDIFNDYGVIGFWRDALERISNI